MIMMMRSTTTAAAASSVSLSSLLGFFIGLALFFGSLIAQAQAQQDYQVGDEVCVEGYLMDSFCISRGTLFDNQSVRTLSAEGPVVHTVHCLLDVPQCIATPFEILLPTTETYPGMMESDAYIRGWRLDETTKARAVELATAAGGCQTCPSRAGAVASTIDAGMHIGLRGVITDMGNAGMPPIISVSDQNWQNNMQISNPSNPFSLLCGSSAEANGGSAYPPLASMQQMTQFPAAAPVVPVEEDPATGDANNIVQLQTDMQLTTSTDLDTNTASFEVKYNGIGYVALGIGTQMLESIAVIGLPDDTVNPPLLYDLTAFSAEGIVPSSQQILQDASVVQEDDTTTLQFTVPLETEPFFVSSSSGDTTNFIYARGDSNALSYHGANRGLAQAIVVGGGSADAGAGQEEEFQVGEEVCVEGYLMDYFCISRGTLFDNQSVRTLSAEGPVVHTVHCLLDVPQCIATPFEILLPATASHPGMAETDSFIRGWRLDDATKDLAVQLATEAGGCQTCPSRAGTTDGTIDRGMHISLRGVITDLGNAGMPPVISVADTTTLQVNSDPSNPSSLLCGSEGSAYPPISSMQQMTQFPTAAPAAVPAPATSGVILLEENLTLEPQDNGDGTATFVMNYAGEGYVSVGVGTQMVGSVAVIGLPDSENPPLLYDLTGQFADGIVPVDISQQILQDAAITQEGGTTSLTFTVPLETEPFYVSANGDTNYVYARGDTNSLSYHKNNRGAFTTNLVGVASAVDASSYYLAHGYIMGIAWGILVPLAIGASLIRDWLPGGGTFFLIHRALNTIAIVMVIVGFGLAVYAVGLENLDHFGGSKHRATGLVIFVFALLQGLNGYLRPHLPAPPATDDQGATNKNDDADEAEKGDGKEAKASTSAPPAEQKSKARKIWEVSHRLLGVALLALSWWNCTTGIRVYGSKFVDGGASQGVTIFWAVVGSLAGVIIIAWIINLLTKKKTKKDKPTAPSASSTDI